MMDAFAREMRAHFGSRWAATVGKTEEEEAINLISWQAAFRERGMTWGQVLKTIRACTSENCPWPTRVDFFGVWDRINATALGRASFRPAAKVLTQHLGTERGMMLEHKDSNAEAKRKAAGRAAMDALKGSL